MTRLLAALLFLPACFSESMPADDGTEAGESSDEGENSDGGSSSGSESTSSTSTTSSGSSEASGESTDGGSGSDASSGETGESGSETGQAPDPYGACESDLDCNGGICMIATEASVCVPACAGDGAVCPDDLHGTGGTCVEIGAVSDAWGCMRLCTNDPDCMGSGSCAGWNNSADGGDDAEAICWWYA